jgi:NADH-quinone oxidoreductase subunit M
MLWLYQRTMFGEITKDANKTLPDLDAREMATLIPIIVLCFWIGLYPAPFLRAMETSVANVIQTVEKGSAAKAVQAKRAAAGQLGNQAIGQSGEAGTPRLVELPNRLIAASRDREGGR